MPTGMDLSFTLAGGGTLSGDTDLTTATETFEIGNDTWPDMVTAFAFGDGDGEVNNWWSDSRTLAATTGDSIDLAGSLENALGSAVFDAVKVIVIDIDTPDGTKKLRFGPQGVTDAAELCFGDAGDYVEFTTRTYHEEPYAGWPIAAGTADLLYVYNPSAVAVTYRIFVGGVS